MRSSEKFLESGIVSDQKTLGELERILKRNGFKLYNIMTPSQHEKTAVYYSINHGPHLERIWVYVDLECFLTEQPDKDTLVISGDIFYGLKDTGDDYTITIFDGDIPLEDFEQILKGEYLGNNLEIYCYK